MCRKTESNSDQIVLVLNISHAWCYYNVIFRVSINYVLVYISQRKTYRVLILLMIYMCLFGEFSEVTNKFQKICDQNNSMEHFAMFINLKVELILIIFVSYI